MFKKINYKIYFLLIKNVIIRYLFALSGTLQYV